MRRGAEHQSSWLHRHDGQGKLPTGDMVIRALVRARLLGMQLLTLEARVVVRPDDGDWTILSPLGYPSRESRGVASGSAGRKAVSAVSGPGLERAIELVEQGAETLERSRRLRWASGNVNDDSPPDPRQ
jgi:hypothetical protein